MNSFGVAKLSWDEKAERLRRKDLKFIEDAHAAGCDVLTDLASAERPALPDQCMAQIDAMIGAHGTRAILRALKQLLNSRVNIDMQRLDSVYGRAARVVEGIVIHADIGAAGPEGNGETLE